MKYTYYLILVFLVFSCGIDQHDNYSNSHENISKRTATPPIELETKMQWTSFMTATVLDEEPLARTEFINLTNGLTEIISFNDVFKVNSVAPKFKNKFLEVLNWYSMVICETGKPEPGVRPPIMVQDPECAAAFLQYISVDNCLEFFFPEGLDLDPILPITTTAHPLTQVNQNYGFRRQEKPKGITSLGDVIVNIPYLNLNDDVIVVRPIGGTICDYSDYGVPDFTLFLNN